MFSPKKNVILLSTTAKNKQKLINKFNNNLVFSLVS